MQLKEIRKNLFNEKQSRLFYKILFGHIFKKYILLGKAQPFLSYKEHRKSVNCKDLYCERKKKVNSISTEIASSVHYFLEQDENSQMCPRQERDFQGEESKRDFYLTH